MYLGKSINAKKLINLHCSCCAATGKVIAHKVGYHYIFGQFFNVFAQGVFYLFIFYRIGIAAGGSLYGLRQYMASRFTHIPFRAGTHHVFIPEAVKGCERGGR